MIRWMVSGGLAACFVAAVGRPAGAAFSGDFLPRLVGSTIAIDGLSDVDGSTAADVSVFEYTLGEFTPGFTSDPGIQPEPGNGLPAGSFLGFNMRGPLLFWNGTGAAHPLAAAADRNFLLYFGASAATVTGTTGAGNGFVFMQLDSQGAGHRHVNAQALGAPSATGAYVDAFGNTYDAAPDGVYAFPIEITDDASNTTNPAQYHSGAKWLVYGQNISDPVLTNSANAIELATHGDADFSGTVDAADFDVWFTHVGANTYSLDAGDFDSTGVVDAADFDVWFNHVGDTRFPLAMAAEAVAVPEAGTLGLLLAGIVMMRKGETASGRRQRER